MIFLFGPLWFVLIAAVILFVPRQWPKGSGFVPGGVVCVVALLASLALIGTALSSMHFTFHDLIFAGIGIGLFALWMGLIALLLGMHDAVADHLNGDDPAETTQPGEYTDEFRVGILRRKKADVNDR